MHRVIFLKVGGQRLHLLKMLGALVLVGSALGVLGTVASMFRLILQIELAQGSGALAMQVFGLTSDALTGDVVLGLFMVPSAWFMFWLALFIVGAMVYRSGGLVIPIEEDTEDAKR